MTIKKKVHRFKLFRIITAESHKNKIICFHGLGGTPNHFWPMYKYLQKDIQLINIGLDQIKGPTPEAKHILQSLREMFNPDDIIGIIGHSAGTIFALAAKEYFPKAKVVVINPSLLKSTRKLWVSYHLKRLPFFGKMIKKKLNNHFFKKGYAAQSIKLKTQERSRVNQSEYDQTRHWLQWSKELSLKPISQPFLHVLGQKDQLISEENQYKLFQAEHLVIHPNGSHMIIIEEPKWTLSIIIKYLNI